MSKFYFFTDLDLLSAQTAAGAFGPAGTSGGKDSYQVTSLHTASADPDVYAGLENRACYSEKGWYKLNELQCKIIKYN